MGAWLGKKKTSCLETRWEMGVNISALLCARCRGPFGGELSTPGCRVEDSVGNAEENPVECHSDHRSRDCPAAVTVSSQMCYAAAYIVLVRT